MSDHQSIEIMPAKPDHAERAAELLYSTAQPIFDYLYGPDKAFRTRIMALQWQADEGFLSHRHAMAAYDADGDLMGLELGFDSKAEPAAFAAAWNVVRGNATAAQQKHISMAGHHLIYATAFTPNGNYCVQNLAVGDTGRATGLGRRLLEGTFQRAAAAGYKAVCLDVLETNPAIGFYRHLGMRLAAETRIPDLMEQRGFPAIYRMVRDL